MNSGSVMNALIASPLVARMLESIIAVAAIEVPSRYQPRSIRDDALRFARGVEAGVLQVNCSPLWRADSTPYGGLKASGIGREGPRWAVEELTELKTVVFHPQPEEPSQ